MQIHKITAAIILSYILCISCSSKKKDTGDQTEKAKQEIAQAEKDFNKMADEKGIAEAFTWFADSNATIRRRNDSLIHGKNEILNFFSAASFKNATVSWTPDFIDVSKDGTLGYTYGRYLWQSKDSAGKVDSARGVFHTVWKKQKDGSWRFVWD